MPPHEVSPARRERRLWALVLSAGFAVRLALLIIKGQRYYFADTLEYDAIARAILSGHGLPAGTPRAPLYPALMAVVVMALAVNFVAAALLAVSPTMIFTSTMLYPTVLFTALLLLVTTLARGLDHAPSAPRAAALGAAMGLMWLTDRIALVPLAVTFAWLAVGLRRPGRRAALAGAMLVALLVASPAALVKGPKPPPGASL